MTQSKRRPRGDTQRMILEYIRETTTERGYPPSVREIGDAVGLTSTATVHVHLKNLEEKGLLWYTIYVSSSVSFCEEGSKN